MSGPDNILFGAYPADYFDFIIIDECHRGGANDEGIWRGILEYFCSGGAAWFNGYTKRKEMWIPIIFRRTGVYLSLKEGINDGFWHPSK